MLFLKWKLLKNLKLYNKNKGRMKLSVYNNFDIEKWIPVLNSACKLRWNFIFRLPSGCLNDAEWSFGLRMFWCSNIFKRSINNLWKQIAWTTIESKDLEQFYTLLDYVWFSRILDTLRILIYNQ